MRYVLENEILRVEIDSFGAELKSVKNKAKNPSKIITKQNQPYKN